MMNVREPADDLTAGNHRRLWQDPRMRSSAIALALVGTWALFILALSSRPHLWETTNAFEVVVRKGGHVAIYTVLGLLAHRLAKRAGVAHPLLTAGLACLVFAIGDELLQTHVAGRDGNPIDVGVDSFGIALGLTLSHYLPDRRPRELV
jgi:VanZ family protein